MLLQTFSAGHCKALIQSSDGGGVQEKLVKKVLLCKWEMGRGSQE